jgi:hypothetical protein
MAYTVAEITELIRYHLVLGESDDISADCNLAQLAGAVRDLATRPLWHEATWVFCDRCGTSVDTDLIHPEGHHYSDDGDFYCVDCWTIGGENV